MPSPSVTVAIVPRERYSMAETSFRQVLDTVSAEVPIVYVTGAAPASLLSRLRELADDRPVTFIDVDRFLPPNEARNIALDHLSSQGAGPDYVAIMDNDVGVAPGWLTAMVDRADITGAAAVAPLLLEIHGGETVVHLTPDECRIDDDQGVRILRTTHTNHHAPLDEVGKSIVPIPADFFEMHAVLFNTSALREVGGFDEALRSSREHVDLALRLRAAGGVIWFEPTAHVTYLSPPPFDRRDLGTYWLRWCERWNRASIEHMIAKYDLDASYRTPRMHSPRVRRHILFVPLYEWTERRLGTLARRAVQAFIRRVEPPVNRALVGRRAT